MGTNKLWMPIVALLVILLTFISVSVARVPDQVPSSRDYAIQSILHHGVGHTRTCHCKDRRLCMPLELAAKRMTKRPAPHVRQYLMKKNKTEVFAFVLECDESVWSKFNWTKLTTIAIAGDPSSDLVCHAHANGVAVVTLEDYPTKDLTNASARAIWIDQKVKNAKAKFLDGINIDYEDALDEGIPEVEGLTSLVKDTAEAFHRSIPGSQVSYDVAWKAGGVDGRYYDYKAIGDYSDVVFIMAYDEQSQIFDEPCNARPNSGIGRAEEGIQSYIRLGLSPEKLVLGVPWYGYQYPCKDFDSKEICYLEEVPFRGANCSDAAGSQFPYDYMVSTRIQQNATYVWDEDSLTPYYSFKDEKSGQFIQMRYDDDRSLAAKYLLAVDSSLRGVGMWTANFLDYSDTPEAVEQQKLMWGTLP